MRRNHYEGLGKAAAICAAALLVSLGLCGVTLLAHSNDLAMGPGLIGLLGIAASTLGLVVVGLIALIEFLINLIKPDKDERQ